MFENDPEVLQSFAEESSQRLLDLERGVLSIEREAADPQPDLLNAVFRDAHSMKAGANLLGLKQVERAAHALENVLDQLRSGRLAATSTVCQALLDGVDLLREILTAPAGEFRLESDTRLTALLGLTA